VQDASPADPRPRLKRAAKGNFKGNVKGNVKGGKGQASPPSNPASRSGARTKGNESDYAMPVSSSSGEDSPVPVAVSAAMQKKKRRIKRATRRPKPVLTKKKKAYSAISHPAPAAAAAPKARSEHQGFQSAVYARVKSGLRTGTSMGEVSVLVGKWWGAIGGGGAAPRHDRGHRLTAGGV